MPVFITLGLFLIALPVLRAERTLSDLTAGWKFIRQDVALDASTEKWASVSVPHTWNNVDAQGGGEHKPAQKYYRGPGWYALALDVPAGDAGQRVFVQFEAASIVAQVYCNGQLVGEHQGAFTTFCCELTPFLHPGGANELRVRVSNDFTPDVPPVSGDFNLDGGLYRPVHLIVTPPVCITPLDNGSPGIYLTPSGISDAQATVAVRTMISNGLAAAANATLSLKILDASGQVVATGGEPVSLAAHETRASSISLTVPSPHRWNARKDPYLYSVQATLAQDGQPSDTVSQPLGLRTVAITNEKGFLLNGQPYPIHGVNLHQDMKGQGWAMSNAEHDTDLGLILDVGATAIRLAHYPQSQYLHAACDRNGLLLWNELSLVNEVRGSPEFRANAEQQLREMILQHYNHPSAVFWGLFNELANDQDSVACPLLVDLKAEIKQLDPSRIVVAASDNSHRKFNLVPDWIAFNAYFGWYSNPLDGFPHFIAVSDHENGDRRIAISEYGAGGNPAQHQEAPLVQPKPGGPFHPEEWQDNVHEHDWARLADNPQLWGTFIWCMFDFSCSSRNEGGYAGLNDKGLVTQDRQTKKDIYFFYQANWSMKPMIYLASRRLTPRKEATTEVKAYSNQPDAELTLNGKALGKATADSEHILRWENVALAPGPNHVVVQAGANLSDSCDWVLESP